MGNTNYTLRASFAYPDGRATAEADSCVANVIQIVAIGGATTGATIISNQTLTQVGPGNFEYLTTNTPLTRGYFYRATYTLYFGGVLYQTKTEDFIAYSNVTSAARDNQTLNLIDCRRIIRRTLGLEANNTNEADNQQPGSATCDEMTNDAIEEWWMRPWLHQTGDPAYIDFHEDQYRYPLPNDFLHCRSVTKPADRTYRFIQKSPEWVRKQREQAFNISMLTTYYAIVYDPPTDLAGTGRWVMEVYPTPTAFTQDAAVIDYKREAPRLSNGSDIVPIPRGMHSAFKQLLRAVCLEQEGDSEAPRERAKANELLGMAQSHDGRHISPFIGSMAPSGSDHRGPASDYIDPDTEVVL